MDNKIKDTSLWSQLRSKSHNIETNMDPLVRKITGSYYTDLELTDAMMRELVTQLHHQNKPLYEYRFLDPCVGAGNFVFSYIKAVASIGITREQAIKLLENIYVADINTVALNSYKQSLKQIALEYWNIELTSLYFKKHLGNGLLIDVLQPTLEYISIRDVFPQKIVKNGFDIVVANPPYRTLKVERQQYNTDEEYITAKDRYNKISQIVNKRFKYSTTGLLNLYKIFVEEIIDQYANETAYISLLVPLSILADKTSMQLRTHILQSSKLLTVKIIKERSGYIDATQALTAMLIHKGSPTDSIEITKDFCNAKQNIVTVPIDDILDENTGNAIIAVTTEEYRIFKKMKKYPTIKELDFIVNLSGELSVSMDSQYITNENTGLPLIRGRDIGFYQLKTIKEPRFVRNEFISTIQKSNYIKQHRIACQQISNINRKQRVIFSYIPANFVLYRTCNFICVDDNKYGIDLYTILGLLNTSIINIFFKLRNCNNHVNTYDIDNFPIPVGFSQLPKISMLAQRYLKSGNQEILDEIESLAKEAYGL